MADRGNWYVHTQLRDGVDVHLEDSKGILTLVAYTCPANATGHVALYERDPGEAVWRYTLYRVAQKALDHLSTTYRQRESILG